MDSELRRTLVVAVLLVSFFLGLLELGKALDPYTMQTVMFRGEKTEVTVYTKRQAVSYGNVVTDNDVSEQNGRMMTRVVLAVPRKGIFITTHTASTEEVELFHRFF